MSSRRKSLNENEVRTMLAVIRCFQEQNKYRYDEMNKTMGSITISDMMKLQNKLDRWYDPEKYNNEI